MQDKQNKKMGRPIIGQPKNVSFSIRLDLTTVNKIKKLSAEKNISQAELIRYLVKKAK